LTQSSVCNNLRPGDAKPLTHALMNESPAKIDALLEPLLDASDDRADEILFQLISVHAEPVIKGVIRFKLRLSTSQRAEADDIYQEVVLQLLAQLQKFRNLPNAHPIGDLRGMAAVIAHRTCSRWLRRQFPERHALKNRLHYLVTRQRGFASWQDSDGQLVTGFAVWQEEKLPTRRAPESEVLAAHVHAAKAGTSLTDTVAAIFNHICGPIEFDELLTAVASLAGVSDQPIESLAEDENAVTSVADVSEPDPAWRLEKRMFLQRLWEELQQLPRNQRAALLLNLKESSGFGCITLFPAIGIATVRQLANALEMTAEGLAEMWNELPLEDSKIAELLGLTRQQVINARKSGRERLTRRLKGFI
jgi:RNA polymerase sigma factor (sigma-70 family)